MLGLAGWQRAVGAQYTANGVLDVATGAFTRTGVDWTAGRWYAIDLGIDATAAGGAINHHDLGNSPQEGGQ